MINETNTLDELLAAGWNPASEPPDDDRAVQVAWDDGSTSASALAFYDTVWSIPQKEEYRWWSHPKMTLLPTESIIAWKERYEVDK